jgi:hypothetical protein
MLEHAMEPMTDLPVFINARDRVTDLRTLVAWFERAGHQRITILDNDSTYEPLLEFYEQTPHEVIRLGENCGSQALWRSRVILPPGEWFVLSDPDVIPLDDCPLDAVWVLKETLMRYSCQLTAVFAKAQKAALGLFLDDVPEDMPSLAHERALVAPHTLVEPGVHWSLVDTTFAVYRPGARFSYDGLRMGHPYQARHTSWYVRELGVEDRYYLDRARPGELFSSWATRLRLPA